MIVQMLYNKWWKNTGDVCTRQDKSKDSKVGYCTVLKIELSFEAKRKSSVIVCQNIDPHSEELFLSVLGFTNISH